MKSIIIIYHSDCADGFSAAWSAWKKFGNKAEYLPVKHDLFPPAGLKNKNIYFLDFCYPASIMEKLSNLAASITVIDHHISEKETTEKFPGLFSLDHSGAVLSWKFFHPKKEIPLLLKYVEDRDLWRFRLPKSKEINSYLRMFSFDFNLWNKLARQLKMPTKRKEWIKNGSLILKYEDRVIEEIITEGAELVRFESYKIFAVNSILFRSELGNLLCRKQPPFSIVWRKEPGNLKFSLRGNGDIDVSKIAKKYGGGGHFSAASFRLPPDSKLPWRSS